MFTKLFMHVWSDLNATISRQYMHTYVCIYFKMTSILFFVIWIYLVQQMYFWGKIRFLIPWESHLHFVKNPVCTWFVITMRLVPGVRLLTDFSALWEAQCGCLQWSLRRRLCGILTSYQHPIYCGPPRVPHFLTSIHLLHTYSPCHPCARNLWNNADEKEVFLLTCSTKSNTCRRNKKKSRSLWIGKKF